MEYLGVFAFIMVMCLLSFPQKVKKLEKKVKKLEKQRNEVPVMSRMMNELVGKHCKFSSEEAFSFTGKVEFECDVLDCDDEWVKFRTTDKKNREIVKMMRLEDIDTVELLEAV